MHFMHTKYSVSVLKKDLEIKKYDINADILQGSNSTVVKTAITLYTLLYKILEIFLHDWFILKV